MHIALPVYLLGSALEITAVTVTVCFPRLISAVYSSPSARHARTFP